MLDTKSLDDLLFNLKDACGRSVGDDTKHKHWRRFIRARDDHRCVICPSVDRIEAHHVARKVIFGPARYQTGNGITLCRVCHKLAHKGFNRRPDLDRPFDDQDGEKMEYMAEFFAKLAKQAALKHSDEADRYYHLSDEILTTFARLQGFPEGEPIGGPRIARAAYILHGSPVPLISAVIAANVRPRSGRHP